MVPCSSDNLKFFFKKIIVTFGFAIALVTVEVNTAIGNHESFIGELFLL